MKDSLVKGVNTLTEDLAKPSDIEITDISNQEIAADIVLRKYIITIFQIILFGKLN